MEESQLQLAPQQVTTPIIDSYFNRALLNIKYSQILQAAADLHFTKDNLLPEYPELKVLDQAIKELDALRKDLQAPYTKVWDDIQAKFNSLKKPLEEMRDEKKGQLKAANQEAILEKKKADAEKLRKENVVKSIGDFINNITRAVSDATTDAQITHIQRLIGSEKSRKGFYAEYYDELVSKCDALSDYIKERKDVIKKEIDISEQMKQTDDPYKLASLKGQQEYLQAKNVETALRLQDTAFDQTASIQKVIAEPMIETVKARTTRWTWKIEDINLLQKKMPHLVKLVPDESAIAILLKSKKAEGALKDTEELKVFGLTFYQEKFY